MRSIRARLEALEAAAAREHQQAARRQAERPARPSFDAVLAGLDLVLAALAEETDPLFWTPAQRAVMERYSRLVGEGNGE